MTTPNPPSTAPLSDDPHRAGASDPQRIDATHDASLAHWADKFDVTTEQLREAVAAVGDFAPDVEMHLKGTRSITNADAELRAKKAAGG